jgi:hypothetical protein
VPQRSGIRIAVSDQTAKLLVIWGGLPLLFVLIVGLTLVLNRYTAIGKRPQDPLRKQFTVIGLCLLGSAVLFTALVSAGLR